MEFYSSNGSLIQDKEIKYCNIIIEKVTSGVIYCPTLDEFPPGIMYPRAIELKCGSYKGKILATFEKYTRNTPFFPIYESNNGGLNWKLISKVEDQKNGWGMRYQPFLFELPVKCGNLKAGTILCAGNSIPNNLEKTELVLYKSVDGGFTWEYMSSIAKGGAAIVDNKDENSIRPIWEPYLYLDLNNNLICYYSDEGHLKDGYNQILAHKISYDGGYTWSDITIDVSLQGGLRPGMPIVTRLPNGSFIMVYEIVNVKGIPVYFRISADGLNWGDPEDYGKKIESFDGSYLTGTPYITWINKGGKNGTIIVTGRGYGYMLANSNLAEGPWVKIKQLVDIDNSYGYCGYSQCLLGIKNDEYILSLCPAQMNPELGQLVYGIGKIYD